MAVKKAASDRVSYLAQLAHAAQLNPSAGGSGKLYGLTAAGVARKSVVRLHKETKRQFCKRCFAPRGTSSVFRIEDKSKAQNRPMLRAECVCGDVRRFPLFERPIKTRPSPPES